MQVAARPLPADGRASLWAILRTSAGRTLALAESLERHGIEAWTPSRLLRRRRPRSQKTVELTVPIMPSFVFVRAGHLPALAIAAELPISPHPPFSIFRHAGRIPLVADREVAGARAEEDKAREDEARAQAKKHRRIFEKGQRVRVNSDAFTGLEGVVEDGGDGKFALVAFGGAVSLSISTFLLTPDEVEAALPRAA
jgi:transcription antitermination factor NusG